MAFPRVDLIPSTLYPGQPLEPLTGNVEQGSTTTSAGTASSTTTSADTSSSAATSEAH